MTYKVSLTYFDDKCVNLHVGEGELNDLLKAIEENKVFMNEKTNVGFWTRKEQLRHMIIVPNPEIDLEEEKNEVESGEKTD